MIRAVFAEKTTRYRLTETSTILWKTQQQSSVSAEWMRPAEAEDVAHIRMHVHAVLLLTCDLTNCQRHRKSTRQDSSASAFTFITLRPSNPPACNAALWENACPAETFERWTVRLCPALMWPQSNICVFCSPSPDFEDLFDDDDIQWLVSSE